jgi:hypothetical protein
MQWSLLEPQVPVYQTQYKKMDPSLIAELELEELQTKEWDCKLIHPLMTVYLKLIYSILPPPPESISNKGTSGYPSGYLYHFPACYNGFKDRGKSNLTSATVATEVNSN